MASTLTGSLLGILGVYLFLRALLHFTQDATEPPAIQTTIPFISPILHMRRQGSKAWQGPQSRLPIYTLRLPGTRMYIVNSTALIPAIQRQVKTISFALIKIKMFRTLMGVSPPSFDIMQNQTMEERPSVLGSARTIQPTLKPGPQLDTLNRQAVHAIAASLNDFAERKEASTVNLFEWLSPLVYKATTESVYGPQSPFKGPGIAEIRSTYEKGIVPLMQYPLPHYTAKKYMEARELLVRAFERYYEERGHDDLLSSAYVRERYRIYSESGIPLKDIARIEVATSIAVVSNAMPATFWLVFHIFSNPLVLEDCRRELSDCIHEKGNTSIIDIAHVRTRCPILFSTFQETFRLHGTSVSTRLVTEDCHLDGYLLKKGSMVLIPAIVQHHQQSVWGNDVEQFSHKRFRLGSRSPGHNPIAFRGFGGGATLCPGRHFAATEILAFSALVILRFDAQPRNGKWVAPTVEKTNLGTSVHQPDHDIEVELRPRDKRVWDVMFTGVGTSMEISAEDILEGKDF